MVALLIIFALFQSQDNFWRDIKEKNATELNVVWWRLFIKADIH